jgi:uncharacterized membrane protein
LNDFFALTPKHQLQVIACLVIIVVCVILLIKWIREYCREFKAKEIAEWEEEIDYAEPVTYNEKGEIRYK